MSPGRSGGEDAARNQYQSLVHAFPSKGGLDLKTRLLIGLVVGSAIGFAAASVFRFPQVNAQPKPGGLAQKWEYRVGVLMKPIGKGAHNDDFFQYAPGETGSFQTLGAEGWEICAEVDYVYQAKNVNLDEAKVRRSVVLRRPERK